jgi:hypothetical protein
MWKTREVPKRCGKLESTKEMWKTKEGPERCGRLEKYQRDVED